MINKNRGITLIALVITILIMLLLVAVAIQMSFGENGLIVKANQAKLEQQREELIEKLKIEYLNLKVNSIENSQSPPSISQVFLTTIFLENYKIVGEDIVDKSGNIIDKKENIISDLKKITLQSSKIVAGVKIESEDERKLILKIRVKSKKTINFGGMAAESYSPPKNSEIDFGDGTNAVIDDFYAGINKEYKPGEYIVKIKNVTYFLIGKPWVDNDEYEIDVLQWNKEDEHNEERDEISINNVKNIYEPEPDKIPIIYNNGKMNEIPDYLYTNKKEGKVASCFFRCNNITYIPENLLDNFKNLKRVSTMFYDCRGITHIPKKLIEKVLTIEENERAFYNCLNADNYSSLPSKLK
jgi:hypothetical protein